MFEGIPEVFGRKPVATGLGPVNGRGVGMDMGVGVGRDIVGAGREGVGTIIGGAGTIIEGAGTGTDRAEICGILLLFGMEAN